MYDNEVASVSADYKARVEDHVEDKTFDNTAYNA